MIPRRSRRPSSIQFVVVCLLPLAFFKSLSVASGTSHLIHKVVHGSVFPRRSLQGRTQSLAEQHEIAQSDLLRQRELMEQSMVLITDPAVLQQCVRIIEAADADESGLLDYGEFRNAFEAELSEDNISGLFHNDTFLFQTCPSNSPPVWGPSSDEAAEALQKGVFDKMSCLCFDNKEKQTECCEKNNNQVVVPSTPQTKSTYVQTLCTELLFLTCVTESLRSSPNTTESNPESPALDTPEPVKKKKHKKTIKPGLRQRPSSSTPKQFQSQDETTTLAMAISLMALSVMAFTIGALIILHRISCGGRHQDPEDRTHCCWSSSSSSSGSSLASGSTLEAAKAVDVTIDEDEESTDDGGQYDSTACSDLHCTKDKDNRYDKVEIVRLTSLLTSLQLEMVQEDNDLDEEAAVGTATSLSR